MCSDARTLRSLGRAKAQLLLTPGKVMDKLVFSFAHGGAVVTRLRKLGILRQAQTPLSIRIILAIGITWIPLLIFTLFQGLAFGDKVQIPFLFDFIQHARFLVALPAAIWAETYISPRYESVLARFLKARVVSGEDVPRFMNAISRANDLKNSVAVELLILGLVCAYVSLGLERSILQEHSSWNRFVPNAHTWVEKWYLWISMPVFLFFWFRWIWRHAVWAYLLFRISRLNLQLISTHPDSAAGLTFISLGHRRYSVLVFSISSILCASIGEEILFGGATLRSYELELTVFFLTCLIITLGPLLAFSPPLIRAKLRDIGKYGVLAANYTQEFDNKWIQKKRLTNNRLLGNPDFQSLSDMQNSYKGVATMRTILSDRKTVVILFIAYVLPVAPLLTTIIPLRRIVSEIFKLLSGI